MKNKRHQAALVFMLSVLGCSPTSNAQPAQQNATGNRPILLELFTSQGCSSCPAADKLMAVWKSEFGDRVIPMTFHVNYWNRLGWYDPFSKAKWTERQQAYNARLGTQGLYTPQMVVDGRYNAVGSRPRAIRTAISAANNGAERHIRLTGELIRSSTTLKLTVETTQLQAIPDSATIWYAVRDGHHETRVSAGENRGQILKNFFVVRKLSPLGRSPTNKKTTVLESQIVIDKTWNQDMLDVVVFAQADKTGSILDVVRIKPLASPRE